MRYTLKIEGTRRASLTREGETEPFWTLDFSGTLTGLGAIQTALAALRKMGEKVGLVALARADGMDYEFIVSTDPKETPSCEEHQTYV